MVVRGECAPGARDGGEEHGLGAAKGKATAIEIGADEANEGEERSGEGEEDATEAFEVEQAGVKGLKVGREDLVGDDWASPRRSQLAAVERGRSNN